MPESLKSRGLRWLFNFVPAFRGTGGWVTYIAADLMEVRIKLPLSLRTRNYVGTIFGGSMYAAIDPVYMLMLIRVLGPGYVVWDKAATIRFRKPARTTLYATFRLTPEELELIRAATADGAPLDRTWLVELVDRDGVVHASIEKILYIRRK